MPRVAIPVTELGPFGAKTVDVAAVDVAADATNHHYLTHPGASRDVFLLVQNGSGGALTVTLTAAAGPYTAGYAGTYAAAITGTVGIVSVPFGFVQQDGTVYVNLSADTSSFLSAFTIRPTVV